MNQADLRHRLRSTHPREWPHRAREKLRQWRDARRIEVDPTPDLPSALLTSPAPAWPMPERWELGEAARAELARSVEAILADEVELLGVRYPNAAAWDVDPVTSTTWDRETPGVGVDLHAEGRDIKLAWELHRLQHLQILAIGSVVLGRKDAADACRELLLDWLIDQRPYLGVAWSSGLEVASRTFSLLIISGALGQQEPGLNAALWHAFTAHARWLTRFPSLHSSANNHRIGELAALTMLGCLAEAHPDSGTWRVYARELETRLADLVHDDGVPAEQSPTYGAYTLEWALLARHALGHVGLRLAGEDRLEAAARFLADICDENGNWPRFGDDDEGSVLRGGLAPEPLPRSVGACLAAALELPHATPASAQADVRSVLLGLDIRTDGPAPGRKRYATGGYTVWRASRETGSSLVLFDHGPLGHGATCGHGHADALSVWWHVDGAPVLVDVGVFRYNGEPTWRRYARSTVAHNTVTVDGRDQSEVLGAFTWGRRATSRLLPAREPWVRASHDGYDPLQCRHERSVRADGVDSLTVEDRVHGVDAHVVHAAWHLDPRWEVRRVAPDHVVLVNHIEIDVRTQGGVLRILHGDGHAGPGTISPSYNLAVPSTTLVVDPDSPAQWTTRFEVRR